MPADNHQFKFYEKSTLQKAWERVRLKGSRGGVDGISIEQFAENLNENLTELSEALKNDKYVPEPPERVTVREFNAKIRPLGMPTIQDKIVQTAVKFAIEPVFNKLFLDCSYAYRANKGHHKALKRVEHYLQQHFLWVTTCDIKSFFDTLDHDILLDLVRRQIQDSRILRLIQLWLKMGVIFHGEYKNVERGVIQGGIISPLLSNIYLHEFDKKMVATNIKLVRYADDFVTLAKSRELAEKNFTLARSILEDELKLQLKPVGEKALHVKSGFIFLGIYFQGMQRIMAPEKLEKAIFKIKANCKSGRERPLGETIRNLNESIQSWRYYYGWGQVQAQFKALEKVTVQQLQNLIHFQLTQKRLPGKQQASDELLKLNWLLDHPPAEKQQLIRQILSRNKETLPPKPDLRKPTEKPRPETKKLPAKTEIKRAIAHKKRKYQKIQASSFDLVVGSHGTFVGKSGNLVVVKKGGRPVQQISAFKLKNMIVISNGVSLSSDVIKLCAFRGIPIDFLDFTGKPAARLSNPQFPLLKVSQAQQNAFENGKAEYLAKAIVEGKVRNQLNLLKYFHKYRKKIDPDFIRDFKTEEQRIGEYLNELAEIPETNSLNELRGKLLAIEGRAASSYWKIIGMILEEDVHFAGRERKGASDLVNSMLNYGYGILYSRIWGAVALAGLNPYISFLHTPQREKPTLTFDLIEEFRPQAVDRVVVSLLTKSEKVGLQGNLLDGETRKKLVENVLERLNTPIKFRKKEMNLVGIMQRQARDLALFLIGERKHYRPFLGKW